MEPRRPDADPCGGCEPCPNNILCVWSNLSEGMTKTNIGAIAAVALLSSATLSIPAARADDSPWVVRLRGLYIAPTNDSDGISVPGALTVPNNGVHVTDRWAPEIGFEYFFARNWSTELVLTYPQRHEVTRILRGGAIGPVDHRHINFPRDLPVSN